MQKIVIIVAGGMGTRMGISMPKQFIEIAGLPVLMHTIKAFYNAEDISETILVLPELQFEHWRELCARFNFTIKTRLIKGGQTRFHSVKNGLNAIRNQGLVAIHDGVRPLVSADTIKRCFKYAFNYGCAIPVVNLNDSVRKIEHNTSIALNREAYKLVQTPQVFQTEVVKLAFKQRYSAAFTDDASVVEAAGYKITLVDGNIENIKITTHTDLIIAESLINSGVCIPFPKK
ncbi:MAG: 2-C-methyl-D-erythritol 4-phosphate cytidylyltransferase [Bacteroidales bacterium]|nr:2-C-methyl-D-erythritol 4-phosphate cytidylyltransferase [Bacteroidales bacterium]